MSKPFSQQSDGYPDADTAAPAHPHATEAGLSATAATDTNDGMPGGDLSTSPDSPVPDEHIQEAAYFRAQARGFEAGYALDDWLWAERELRRK